MLAIRSPQMRAFYEKSLLPFEAEMMQHSRDFSPHLCKVLGDEALLSALRQMIQRAEGYGFTYRGPIRLFIEMSFLFGSAFDSDPQYSWASELLRAPKPQMDRAEMLYEKILHYQRQVSGPGGVHTINAGKTLLDLAGTPGGFEGDAQEQIRRVFPQKASYVGPEPLTLLAHAARAEAGRHRFPTPRGETLLTVLMFSFGHGCTHDALYPWIARTLNNEKLATPAAKAGQLEKRSVAWLKHVFANGAWEETA